MRPTDVPDTGLLCDLLWADPDKDTQVGSFFPLRPMTASTSSYLVLASSYPCIICFFHLFFFSACLSSNHQGWGENDRGVSFTFGAEVVEKFLHKHDMDLICRAHQVVEDGYEFFAKRQLVTIFSAPNYCGMFMVEFSPGMVETSCFPPLFF